ncbi:uncharacterized protein PV09_04902 [Verruconis gallopava]|uniref:Vacuolar ATPase assembly protein VMA22 n=1 Tax=Verruconis gallopava TaxID=253628 RepID=A0A0D2AC51_9PEZI|nr:uncharacterized protein PV09_04902 [Verruconis gallopava]KIW04085.1 hypothetical protein PV09_04902 [Verruconis gallopava]
MATTTTGTASNEVERPSRTAEDLVQSLDDLFERYLDVLDRYQKARQDLSRHFAAGYLSLAQANFLNKGRRYGQDYYDERMQAQRVVRVSTSGGGGDVYEFTCVKRESAPVETPADAGEDDGDDAKKNETKPASKDPLQWFGILVAQPLRAAQASFTTAVEGSVPELVTLQVQLRNLEIEIGRTRKMLKKLEKV